ncbi:MAG: hypothetical protein WBH99_12030 [Azovibrio sp.]|uniref:hypothetical protein n=1 Tax=Azovibrio sp. TaxID=1872673 RepID=UPI003C73808E
MSESPYTQLARLTAAIEQRAEAGNWEDSAALTQELLGLLQAGHLPPATAADRPALEAAQKSIAAITERAEPLRDDIARLLKAFG